MSERQSEEPINPKCRHAPSAGNVLMAVLLASPALYFDISKSSGSGENGAVLVAAGLLLTVALATMASYDRLIGQSVMATLTGRNAALASACASLCTWTVPVLWLFLGSHYLLDVANASVTWPLIRTPWIAIAAAAITALSLSYLPIRAVLFSIGALAVVEIGIAVVVLSVVGTHRRHAKAEPAWTLDSTGTPTQFVQEEARDPSRTSQDPDATIPKVDGNGNPVWVYNALDAAGNLMLDSRGNPVVVPTDSQGRLAPLPPGCSRAAPEYFHIANGLASNEGGGQFQFPVHSSAARSGIPAAADYSATCLFIALFTLPLYQLLSCLRRGAQPSGSRWTWLLLVLILIQFAACGYITSLSRAMMEDANFMSNMTPPPEAAPIGDMMQLFGVWAFGSPRANWWLMFSQMCVLVLTLIASTSISLRMPSVFICDTDGERIDGRAPESTCTRLLARAAVAALLCAAGWKSISLGVFRFLPSGIATLSASTDLVSLLWLAASLAILSLCVCICLARMRASTGMRASLPPVVGLVTSVLAILALLAGLLIPAGDRRMEMSGSVLLCVGWMAGWYLVRRKRLRSTGRALAGLCPACGYDLRGTSDRCPECGRIVAWQSST